MLAIMVVLITCLIFIIIGYIMYDGGYKQEGIMLLRGSLGTILIYTFLVLLIGAAPSNF